MPRILPLISACLVLVPWQAALPAGPAPPEAIRAEIALLRESGHLGADGPHMAAPDLIAEVYEQRGYMPAWGAPGKVESLLAAIRASYREGLSPSDYHREGIERIQQSLVAGHELSAGELASFDVMLTDSLIRLTYHQRYGKVDLDKRDATRAFSGPIGGRDALRVVQEMLDAETVADAILAFAPHEPDYQDLKAALQQYRALAANGGWPEVPGGPTIRPGSDDPRLATLAMRLTLSGDFDEARARVESSSYDADLQSAVKRFQARHGLEADALVGPATLRALNVSVEQRIDQIRVNLERARWRSDARAENAILVNIAGFRAYVIRDGKIAWTTKVIVGDVRNRTPVFSATMNQVVFNPAWTVPYKIATEEMLPDVKRDPGVLIKGNYQLFDRDGSKVDPYTVDWPPVRVGNFPFTLVQDPGPSNQLGQVKFVFPNEHSVYMHDTPGKYLFAKASRAFSHGCIRVDKPLRLAEVILGSEGWTREQIDSQIESEATRTISLARPLPVYVLYWTAEVDEQGTINFFDDIYSRDAAVLESLDR